MSSGPRVLRQLPNTTEIDPFEGASRAVRAVRARGATVARLT